MHSETDMNPFMNITPRDNESMIGRKAFYEYIKSGTEKALNGEKIIIISGDYGSGKTIIIDRLIRLLEKNKIEVIELSVTKNILNDLRDLPMEKDKDIFVIIDRFDLTEGFEKKDLTKLLDFIEELAVQGLTFLIKTTQSALKRARPLSNNFTSRLLVHHLPMLDYTFARQMVIDRLNESRKIQNDLLEPFTDEELRTIWKKASGNPRMVLMLCASLYDQKT